MQPKTITTDNGFTLIEALSAIAVLSIGILTLNTMQLSAIKGNSKADIITTSSNAIRDQVEKMLGKDFNDSDFSTGTHAVTGSAPIQSVNWSVTDWKDDGINNDGDAQIDEFDERGVKNIQLTIQYRERGFVKSTEIQFFKTEIF